MRCMLSVRRYSAKTLECLAALPADGLTDLDYNVIVSLIQYIVLHKPVSHLVTTAQSVNTVSRFTAESCHEVVKLS